MKNTHFSYMYRDASNYKQSGSVVLAGRLTFEQIEPFLQDGVNFIASDVGLVDLQTQIARRGFAFPDHQDDHVFSEVTNGDLEATNSEPNAPVTAKQLYDNMKQCHEAGWPVVAAMARLGLQI